MERSRLLAVWEQVREIAQEHAVLGGRWVDVMYYMTLQCTVQLPPKDTG